MSTHIVKLDPKFLAGAADASLEFTPPDTDADVVRALATNGAFPFRQIEFGKIAAKVAGDRDLKFAKAHDRWCSRRTRARSRDLAST